METAEKKETLKANVKNYKADGTKYDCEIEIFPIFNNENTLTHYLAIEQELV